jgi:nucleotide-binding universal stress UspA family protein
MLSKILVPLDGSELAEAVLPYVLEVSQRCEPVQVTMLRVVSLPTGRTGAAIRPSGDDPAAPWLPDSPADIDVARHPIYRDQAIEAARREVEVSLAPAAAQLRQVGISACIDVAFGRPAEEIIDYAERNGMDLIVMSTHGRSGLSRWILGSVADKVLHGTHLPILLVRPPGLTGIPFPPQSEIQL